jgi:hypothetical protein
MNVHVINDNLDEFYTDIESIEEDGRDVFLMARKKWQGNWNEYVVWHDGAVIQTVINPDLLDGWSSVTFVKNL